MKNFSALSRIEQHAFPGARFNYREPPQVPQSDVVWMTARDSHGDWIAGIFAPGDPGNNICVIHFYGNDENLRLSQYMIDKLRSYGASVLIFDYRGYGASHGRPREASFYSDAELIYDWLREAHPDLKVILSGWSIGSTVAIYLAEKREVQGLMLFSPPTNMVECVSHIIPKDHIFFEEAMPFQFDAQEKIRRVSCPILMIHGMLDRQVPFKMSAQLEKAIRSPLTRLDLPAAGHHDLFAVGGTELWNKVYEFLDSSVEPKQQEAAAR
ncbi:alpha/beta hydrolase [Gammaproteobacteria bacterium]|nr:alpha/beta hydrolase [Gammaproteobacteria bacterium]